MNRFTGSSLPDGHALHDRLLVARAAADDLDAHDRTAAKALLERCPDCRALAAELRALRSTASALPAPGRPRDFRLTAAQAERLRGGALRRLLAPLGAPAFGFLQPLAGAAVAIGLGLLVVTSLPMAMGGAASAPQPQFAEGGQPAAASDGAAQPSPQPTAATAPRGAMESPGRTGELGSVRGSGAGPSPTPGTQTDKSTGAPGSPTPSSGQPGSGTGVLALRDELGRPLPDWRFFGVALVVLGLGLLVARRYARREDPLLR
jgi:hypothetical protein